jgi:hypothetical protein
MQMAGFVLGVIFALTMMFGYLMETKKKLAVILMVLVWVWCLLGCSAGNKINSEDSTMSIVRAYNHFDLTLPASPGNESSVYSVQAGTLIPEGIYWGMNYPRQSSPGAMQPVIGCSDDSNINIVRYRYTFLGSQAMRPGVNIASNGIAINMGRRSKWYTGGGSTSLFLPFVGDQWEEINETMFLVQGVTPQMLPTTLAQLSEIILDTRNLQDVYYNTTIKMLLEVDIDCVPVL